ncbi:carbohydrate ABC transporter permease [Ruminiclostridium cellobioparum]|jgi:multiple sugar transport system permease protein|uniref:carbohydrate ABC transporter permease n=1 Tax=Ruminiclostridium cellobioparum TaxID=29355 RepID=UPI0004886E7C|nr:carbohydrate ABC transporter permease [Ruminiclostridium cellobioparum]
MNRKFNVGNIAGAVITLFIAVLVLGPFLWLLVSSFKTDAGVITYPPKFFPEEWTLKQYKFVSRSIPVFTMLKNTVIFSGFVTLISVFFDSLAGYAFARMRFRGRKLLFSIILMTMMVPFQIIMTPLYIEVYKMGLLDTYAGLILPRATSAFGIYMLCSFFEGLPKSLEESGRMDGMNEFRIYWSLMLPLCKPALVSLAIFHFMNNWNDLLYPLMLTSSAAKRTLSAGLAILVGNKVIKYGPTLAATMISLAPLLILYIFCQRYFVEGIATTGAKE